MKPLVLSALALLSVGCASTPDNVDADTHGLYHWDKHYYAVPEGYRVRCRQRQLTVFTPNSGTLTGEAGIQHLTGQAGVAVNADAVNNQPIIALRRTHCGHARGRYGRLPLLVNGGLGLGAGRAGARANVRTGGVRTNVQVNTRVPKL